MSLTPRLKGVLLVLAVIIVLPTALFFSIEPFISWYGWRAVERNRAVPVTSNPIATSTAPAQPQFFYTLNDAKQEIGMLHDTINELAALALAPKDEKQRPLLTRDLVSFLVHKGWETRTDSSITTDWNEVVVGGIEPVKLERDEYALTVPYSSSWGNPRFGVQPYEFMQEGVEMVVFGPITNLDNEMTGVLRPYRFSIQPLRSASEALLDEESIVGEEWCGSPGRRAAPTDIVRVGAFQALRLEDRGCEGGSISYEVFGKKANYLFSVRGLAPDDTLLRWAIERFREK